MPECKNCGYQIAELDWDRITECPRCHQDPHIIQAMIPPSLSQTDNPPRAVGRDEERRRRIWRRAFIVASAIILPLFVWAGLTMNQTAQKREIIAQAGPQRVAPDGTTMVWVPGGSFQMGNTDRRTSSWAESAIRRDEEPDRKVEMDGFWIGKHEVTNAQYRAFCAATGREFPTESDQGDAHPVVSVDWYDAKAYCDHYGLSLPPEAQWEYAASGPESRIWPWGNEWDGSKLCWHESHKGTLPVGSFPGRKSKCCAHHLKAISEAREEAPASDFLATIELFFRTAILLDGLREEIDETRYWACVAHMEQHLDELLAPPRGRAAEVRIANRLRKQRPHLLTFLYVPEVAPTNNLAERQLRPAVIARKLSAGNKTAAGVATFEVLVSLAATCRQQGRSFARYVAESLSLGRSPPALFAAD
jgi:hypothetical protein